jgi:hypothetical protein
MRIGRLALVILGIVLVGATGFRYARECLAVDACMDAGGSFDYLTAACDHQQNHPYRAYSPRNPTDRWIAAGGGLLMLAGALLYMRPIP